MFKDAALQISAGREFQRVGAATLKALSPKVHRLVRGWRTYPCLRTADSGMGYKGREGQIGNGGQGH